MNRNVIETVLGAVVLVVAAIFITVVYEARNVSGGNGYHVHAAFDNVAGISAGSDVRIGGIKIGTVTAMELDAKTYRAQVEMVIRPDVELPDDSSAAIVSEGLLGGKYVNIVPGADDRMLVHGDEIRFTQSSVNLEELIGKFMFSGGGVEGDAAASSD